jgi:hypothetical protein
MNEVKPFLDPVIGHYAALALIAVFVLIGLHFSYRAFMYRFVFNKPFNDPKIQAVSDTLPPHRSTLKAIAAFVTAGFLAWLAQPIL